MLTFEEFYRRLTDLQPERRVFCRDLALRNLKPLVQAALKIRHAECYGEDGIDLLAIVGMALRDEGVPASNFEALSASTQNKLIHLVDFFYAGLHLEFRAPVRDETLPGLVARQFKRNEMFEYFDRIGDPVESLIAHYTANPQNLDAAFEAACRSHQTVKDFAGYGSPAIRLPQGSALASRFETITAPIDSMIETLTEACYMSADGSDWPMEFKSCLVLLAATERELLKQQGLLH
ncbi:hypothetical protein [Pannonibacter sp.]|uniref:hypothetical protein n=1 Tax=Pannonibacter sp. TaxID=1906786 RepID=UPI003F6F7B19